MRRHRLDALLVAGLLMGTTSCSVQKFAANGMANAIASGPDVYGTEDDPDLVREAVPFGLKTMESLLEVVPKHRGLLLSACRGFTQYGFAFVQLDAEAIESEDREQAKYLRDRALRLYQRALGYGLRGLELDYEGIGEELRTDPGAAAARIDERHLPLLYWTAAAWGSAIALAKDRPEMLADLPAVRALMERGLALDETYDGGAFHEAMIVLESVEITMGASPEKSQRHFDRAIELSKGEKVAPYVTYAESVAVARQDRAAFDGALHQALAVDPDRNPSQRLANLILQKKARTLLDRADELFLEPLPEEEGEP
jgi:predicted anti-sigma-YlaC factor YlaD